MKSLKLVIKLALFFGLFSCINLKEFDADQNSLLSADEVYKKYPEIRPLWEGQHRDGVLWTTHTLRQLEKIQKNFLETIPTDLNIFCPNYASLNREQRKYFWTFLISMMTRFESNFDPNASYEEGFDDSGGAPVVSRGLLQISFESSKSYDCGFTSAEQIHDPYKNLTCGLNILKKWIPADRSIAGYANNSWRGGARYWSTLRAADKESYNTIVEQSRELSLCR